MGIVWETYHKGVPCPWESLESPLNQPTHWMVLQESAMAAEQIEDGELDFVAKLHLSHLFSWFNHV